MGQKYPRSSARAQEIEAIEQAVASIRSALDVLRQAGSQSQDQDRSVLNASIEQVRAAAAAITSATEQWPATPVSSDTPTTAPARNTRRSTG